MCPTGSAGTAKLQALRSAFDVIDVDHDGKISLEDLRSFYAGYAAGAAAESIDDVIGSMISVADANGDGYVEYDDFEKVVSRGKIDSAEEIKNGRGKLMEDVFRFMDTDGDGKVGHEDLKRYLSWTGFEAGDEDIAAMIRLAGGDESGGVTYEGLLKILAV